MLVERLEHSEFTLTTTAASATEPGVTDLSSRRVARGLGPERVVPGSRVTDVRPKMTFNIYQNSQRL